MKKVFIRSLVAVCVASTVLFSSCTESTEGFLDSKEDEVVDINWVFSDSIRSEQFLTYSFSRIVRTYFAEQGGTAYYSTWDGATDNMCIRWTGSDRFSVPLVSGAYGAVPSQYAQFLTNWSDAYQAIGQATNYIKNIEKTPISAAKKTQRIAEARFLRAYFYYYLVSLHGGVPLLKDETYTSTSMPKDKRATFDEMVNYIVSEMDAVTDILPKNYQPSEYGRPERGAALALKAKVLWLAASPLYNGGNVGEGENRNLLGYDSYDVSRWEKAKIAIEAVMNYGYTLIEDNATRPGNGFYLATTTRKNTETIFQILYPDSRFTQSYTLPSSCGGQYYQHVYHNLVKAFPMKTGEAIDAPGSSFNAANPYVNRDPRLTYSVFYDGSSWRTSATNATPKKINLYYLASPDGMGIGSGSMTGYILRKFCNENNYGNAGGNTSAGFPLFRFADFKLMYAEVLTELDVNANRSTIESQLFDIRKRAGITAGANNRYGIAANLSKDDMIACIINERRIELVAEGLSRFLDLKRRKIKSLLTGSRPEGMKIDNLTTPKKYEVITVRNSFNYIFPRDYHFPIPLSEYNKAAGNLVQNPGW